MADLSALFSDYGLQGVLPYAFTPGNKGYQFVIQRLLNGTPFWIIVSNDSGIPLYAAKGDKIYFLAFSEQLTALKRCESFALDKLYTTPVQMSIPGRSPELFKRYRDLGITHLCFDDSIWFSIHDLSPSATYDGYVSQRIPLRNAQLNAAMYSMLQYLRAGISCDQLIAYFWELLKQGRLFLPVHSQYKLKPGQKLDLNRVDFYTVLLNKEDRALLAFTDYDFVRIFATEYNLSHEEYSVGYTPDFSELATLLSGSTAQTLLLNFCSGNLILDIKTRQKMEAIFFNQSASATANA